jgi:hypothetical protein
VFKRFESFRVSSLEAERGGIREGLALRFRDAVGWRA